MVAKNDFRIVAETANEPQRLQGFGATIDEITGKPQLVDGRIKSDFLEQAMQCRPAALHVPDRVNAHEASVRRGVSAAFRGLPV